jgi:hypothetical protein
MSNIILTPYLNNKINQLFLKIKNKPAKIKGMLRIWPVLRKKSTLYED